MKRILHFLLQNQGAAQTVVKNTFWQFVSQILGRLIRALLIIGAVRILGPENYGIFSYALNLASLFLFTVDAGIEFIVTRDIAGGKIPKEKTIAAAIYIKAILSCITYLAMIIIATHISPIKGSKIVIPFVGLALIFDAIRQLGFAIVRAMEKMQIEAGINLISQTATLAAGITALLIWKTPLALSLAYAAGGAIGLVNIIYYLKPLLAGFWKFFDWQTAIAMLKNSWPFAFIALGTAVLTNTDTTMLGWFSTPKQIGYYSAALKPIQVLFVLPGLIAISTLPMLTRLVEKGGSARGIIERSLSAAILLALPIIAAGMLMPQFIISQLFGEKYLPAINPFRILILTILFNFPSTIIGYAVLAFNQQSKIVGYFLAAAALNILLNFIFIPAWGINGAAVSTVISQAVIAAGYFLTIKRIEPLKILPSVWRPLIAVSVMSAVAILLKSLSFPDFLTLVIAGLSYLISLKLLREPTLTILVKTLRDAKS